LSKPKNEKNHQGDDDLMLEKRIQKLLSVNQKLKRNHAGNVDSMQEQVILEITFSEQKNGKKILQAMMTCCCRACARRWDCCVAAL